MFKTNNRIIGVLQNNNAIFNEIWGQPSYHFFLLSITNHLRQGFHHKVKQKRGVRVALAHPTECGEVRSNLAIYVHRSPARGDHLHHSGHPAIVESLPEQAFPKEGPTDRIIRLVEIQFQEDCLEVFGVHLMERFVEHQDSIKDITALNEG